MKKNVLSLFDGICGLQLSLKVAKVDIDQYYSSEIDENAMSITQERFPNTIQLGDVKKIEAKDLPKIWLISAGSPCQSFSFMGKRKGMTTKENIDITTLEQYMILKKQDFEFEGQSYLFWEFIRLKRETKSKYFFFENVRMAKKWKYIISRELGVLPIEINSNLLTAQNRYRCYWTNIPGVSIPKDMGIHLSDVIQNAIAGYGVRGRKNEETGKYEYYGTMRKDFKANCIVTKIGNTGLIVLRGGKIRKITIEEAELLQGLPMYYTKVPGVSKTARFKSIGNGWTIDVTSHLLKGLKNLTKLKK